MHVAAPDPLSCSKRLLAAGLISSKNKVCIQKMLDGISSAAFLQASDYRVIHSGESSIGVSIPSRKYNKKKIILLSGGCKLFLKTEDLMF